MITTDEMMNAKSERPNCSDDIIRNAQLNAAEALRKQQLEVERVDKVLSLLKEMKSNESEQDLLLDETYEFRGLREVREELNQYTALVQHVMSLAKRHRSNYSNHEYVADNVVEKARDDCDIRNEFDYHNPTTSTATSRNLINPRMSHLAITPTTTVHVSPGSADTVPKCNCDNPLHIRPKEVLVDARRIVQNQRIYSASEPGSLMQLVQPTVTANQKPHPFLSQAGSNSHSLHAAMQNVLGSLKRTLPGFHPTASAILKSDVVDFISAFAAALRRYDDRIRSQIKLLLEKYDSSISNTKRSELVCEIDHLHKISRSATIKREQLLDIIRGPYYQAMNCPLLRQMKILHSTFSSNLS
ncbi:hypothetical protein LOAG_09973 [Loa loa]|uniref:Uncharacterized protein n=2 Tax=Loa loa TaxID=7209 RepID=A0A1S0TQQ2_LOALO|nr:hypothetical protein LOAG_09973 [Loa loa]EFO18523.1 hypothetical protein LOAG_09973 [Loa loa]